MMIPPCLTYMVVVARNGVVPSAIAILGTAEILPSSNRTTLESEVAVVDVSFCQAFCACTRGRIRWRSSNHHPNGKPSMFSVLGLTR